MISTLTGEVGEKLGEIVVLEVHGVGYGLLVTTDDYSRLQVGDPAKLYVYEHIRDDTHDLFGFIGLDTKALFEQLLSVNGVGPKMALNVLSIGAASQMRQAIASGDTKFLQSASGVGKRVAERIVVDLKDKVGLASSADESILFMSDSTAQQDEAVQALVSLGYSPQDALLALANVDPKLSTEDRLKQALKGAK